MNMKKIYLLVITCMFCFMTAVNAEEKVNSDVFTLNDQVGGTSDSIIQINDADKVKYYYKFVKIDDTQFNQYAAAKYGVENNDSASEAYTQASTKVQELETGFLSLIPAVSKPSDLTAEGSGWTAANGKVITLANLVYNAGQHSGYLMAVAAVKDGDTANVYIVRKAFEATSATTLGAITYLDADKTVYQSSSNADTQTESNPSTGISDYAIYLVPMSIILGSVLIFKKNYA